MKLDRCTTFSKHVFICSSDTETGAYYFKGYCFIGRDFIFDLQGAQEFLKQTGRFIKEGQDGCYVSMIFGSDGKYRFHTDYAGNKKLFYYWERGFWAVSNSFSQLLHKLKCIGKHVTPNLSMLKTIPLDGTVLSQLYSFDTACNEIKLVPAGLILAVNNESISIEEGTHKQITVSNYSQGIKEFVDLWRGRFLTLLDYSEVFLESALTGGLDSRAVFSIIAPLLKYHNIRIHCGSIRGDQVDLLIAGRICRDFGIDINTDRPRGLPINSAYDSYQSWKDISLGVYHPIYFSYFYPSLRTITVGGGGGENHRAFYRQKNLWDFIMSTAKKINDEYDKDQFIRMISSAFSFKEINSSKLDPLIWHYRNFRNRLHSGRGCEYHVHLQPLSSGMLDGITSLLTRNALRRGQINYDIISVSCPKLLEYPFDSEEKSMNVDIKNSLVKYDGSFSDEAGIIYGQFDYFQTAGVHESQTRLDLLKDELLLASKQPVVNDIFSSEFIEKQFIKIDRAIHNKKFNHATDGKSIAAILTAGLF